MRSMTQELIKWGKVIRRKKGKKVTTGQANFLMMIERGGEILFFSPVPCPPFRQSAGALTLTGWKVRKGKGGRGVLPLFPF
jgi:hypothetical protein